MEDDYDEYIKRAVFSKVKKVNHLIKEVTIGPNSISRLNIGRSSKTSTPKPVQKLPSCAENKNLVRTTQESGIPTRQFVKLLDLDRQELVQHALNERLAQFKQFSEAQEEQSKQSWLKAQQAFIKDMEKQEMHILDENHQYDLKQAQQHAQMAQLTHNAKERMKHRQEILRERERQRQALYERINKIKLNQQRFSLEYQQIVGLLKSCVDSASLKQSQGLNFDLLNILPSEMDTVVEKCKGDSVSNISDEDVQVSDNVIKRIVDFKSQFKAVVDTINKKSQTSQNAKASVENRPKQQISSVLPFVLPQTTPVSTSNTSSSSSSSRIDSQLNTNKTAGVLESDRISELTTFVSVNDLKAYVELMAFHEEFKKTFILLDGDQSLKTFRFDLKKAVNIPINSLSGINSEHIMDKYNKLHRLLSGQPVTVGDKLVNAKRHPQGPPFCMDLLAKQFVLQGGLLSSNPESAFCYASVILSLWNDFPDFGRLLLAYFFKTCPYLVPYYIPKQVNDTDKEFYTKLGYQYSDGEVERQDKFLKRMTGIIRLYFAIMIAKPRRGQPSSPYNLKHAWKWLASFVRLEPQPDITATALHVFLETVGFEMLARYGRVFQKLLVIIIHVFLPKCKEAECTGGAVTRLETLLAQYQKNNTFEKTSGYTEYAYW